MPIWLGKKPRGSIWLGSLGTGGGFPAFNLKASNTVNLRAAIAAVRAGVSDAALGLVDDSTGRGNSDDTTAQFERSWFSQFAQELEAQGLINTWWDSLFGTGNLPGERATYTNNWVTSGGFAGSYFNGSSLDTVLAYTPSVAADRYRVIWYNNNTGRFSDQINEGAVNSPASGGGAAMSTRLVSAPSIGLNTIKLISGPTTAGARVFGIDPYRSDRKQLRFLNFSINGGQTSNTIVTTQPYASGNVLKYMAASMAGIVLGMGINEGRNNVPVATFKTNKQAEIDLVKLGSATCDIVLKTQVPDDAVYPGAPQADYVAAMYELAIENDCPLIPVFESMGSSFDYGDARGWYDDNVHPSQSGYRHIAVSPMMTFYRQLVALG